MGVVVVLIPNWLPTLLPIAMLPVVYPPATLPVEPLSMLPVKLLSTPLEPPATTSV